TSAIATCTVAIAGVELQPDPIAGGTSLFVGGTSGDDTIILHPGSGSGEVTVLINGETVGTFTPTSRLVVYGQAGDDDIQVAGGVDLPAWLYGGDGNDRLNGGNRPNVLLGGNGDDTLLGGTARDIMIGGAGVDHVVGNGGDDVMIG